MHDFVRTTLSAQLCPHLGVHQWESRRTIGDVGLAEDDDGLPGRSDPSDDLLHIVIPDDIRELDAEVAAYHREIEQARREERRSRRRSRFLPRWARGGLPSPVFTVALIVIASTGLLLSVFAPVTQEQPRTLPISSLAHPKVAVGRVGGLLPDVQLVGDTQRISTRAVRPAVLILVPATCDCAEQVRQIVGQAGEVPPAPYTVIVSAGQDTTAAKLADAREGGHGEALGVRDVNGVLARTYHASATDPTLLFVAGDGVLTASPTVFHVGGRIEGALAPLHF